MFGTLCTRVWYEGIEGGGGAGAFGMGLQKSSCLYSSSSLIRTPRDRPNRFELTGVRINRGPEVEMSINLSLIDG